MRARASRPREPKPRPAAVGAASRWERLYPLLVGAAFVAAVLLRIAAFYQARSLPNGTSDGLFYEAVAQKIADGSYLKERTAFNFSPLYVFFLATVFKTLGHSLNAVRAVQLALGLGSCGLIYLIAGRLFNRVVALLALSLAALYVTFVHFEVQLLGITLAVFLMLLSLHLLLAALEPPRPLMLLPSGICLGLSALSAPTLLVLALPVALWIAVLRGSGPRLIQRPTPQALGHAALFLGAVVLGVLPATVWNYRTTGEIVLVSSQGGVNFFIGNNPEALGFFVVPKGMEDSLAGINVSGAKRIAEAETHQSLTAREVSDHWFKKGLRFITDQPAAAARLFLRKAFLFVNRYEIPLDVDQDAFHEYLPLLRWPLVSFGVVSVLGWTGAVICFREFRRHSLLLLMLLAYALSVVAFFVSDRYRLPAVPFLILFAAVTLDWALQKVRKGQTGPLLLALVGAVIAGILVVFAPIGFQGARASLYFNMAMGYLDQKDLPHARVELQKCVEQDPDWLEARYKLALVNHHLGDPLRALDEVDVVVARAPRAIEAHELRGRILLERGLPRIAANEFRAVLSLSPSHGVAADKLQEAERAAQAAVTKERLAALDADGWRSVEGQQYSAAIASFAELLASAPAEAPAREKALAGMGFSYANQGRLDLATRAFEDGLAVNPQNGVMHKNLALLYLKQGKRDQARPHVETYARLNPGDPMLADLQAQVSSH